VVEDRLAAVWVCYKQKRGAGQIPVVYTARKKSNFTLRAVEKPDLSWN
jgi:hypothetical protein